MRNKVNIYYFITACEGALILMLELVSGKWLATIIGSSNLAWMTTLCVTMLGYLLGYFLGAKLVKSKSNPIELLLQVLGLATLVLLAMPIVMRFAPYVFLKLPFYLSLFSLSAIVILPAVVLLSSTTAIIVQILSKSKDNTADASQAGYVFACSTIGGVVGIIITGFFLLESVGYFIHSLIMVLIAICMLLMIPLPWKRYLLRYAIMLCLLFPVTIWAKISENSKSNVLYQSDGIMGQLKVIENGSKRMLENNGATQSAINKNDLAGASIMNYVHAIGAISSVKPKDSRVLLIGMAAGSLVNEFSKLNFKIDVIDIDKRTLSIAKKYFNLNDGNYTFIDDDGRHYLRSTQKKYDLVIIDISISDIQPYYLYTLEAFREVKKCLNSDGIFLINFIDQTEEEKQVSSRAILHTMEQAGFHTFYNDDVYSGMELQGQRLEIIQEKILIGNMAEDVLILEKQKMNSCCLLTSFAKHIGTDSFAINKFNSKPNDLIFRDDLPLLEKLKFEQNKIYRQEKLKKYITF